MAVCEMCGRDEGLVRVELEGSIMEVCSKCAKHGKVLGKLVKKVPITVKKALPTVEEIEERVVLDFGERLRGAREKKGLKREDFAKMLNEKESLVEKWEKGSLSPRLEAAKKVGKILRADFVEKVSTEKVKLGGVKSGEMTLGDMIKIRKRKQ